MRQTIERLETGGARNGTRLDSETRCVPVPTLRPEWKLQRDQMVDRGTAAYMVLKVLGIRGGVNFNLLGGLGVGDRRYALRELIYHDVMAGGPPYRFISGAELVDVIGKADARMAGEGRYPEEPASVVEPLGSRPAGE